MAILWNVDSREVPLYFKRIQEQKMVPHPNEILPEVKAVRLMFAGIVTVVTLLTAWLGFLVYVVSR
jgi:hypothetical protein